MTQRRIVIDLGQQRLDLFDTTARMRSFTVSTSRFGPGEQAGSFKTPRGHHIIRAKIGAGQLPGTVFVGRRPSGETYSERLACAESNRDWILTRILWLSGTEIGKNRLGPVDTMRRYIYIHGSPGSVRFGAPGSIGCVRMTNADVIELFDLVPVGTPVEIRE